MKFSNKQDITSGTILLIISAFFFISIVLQPLDFGAAGPGRSNFLFALGKVLTSVYGFSSILIPSFLLISSLLCFSSKWTIKKTLFLLTAVVPFFTCAGIEKICRLIALNKSDSFIEIKIVITLMIGIMLLVIEILAAGILAEKVTKNTQIFEAEKQRAEEEDITQKNIQQEHECSIAAKDETEKTPVQKSEAVQIKDPFAGVFDELENPSAILTQEEYEALTDLDEDNLQNESIPDELDWPEAAEIKAQAGSFEENISLPEKVKEEEITDSVSEEKSICNDNSNKDACRTDNENTHTSSLQAEAAYEAASFAENFINEKVSEKPESPFDNPLYTASNENIAAADNDMDNSCGDKNSELDPDFFDIDINEQTQEEIEAEEELEEAKKIVNTKLILDSEVFSQMEEDAREELGAEAANITIEDIFKNKYAPIDKSAFKEEQITQEKPFNKIEPAANVHYNIFNAAVPKDPYSVPANLLTAYQDDRYWIIDDETKQNAVLLKETLNEFNIKAEITGIKKGPVVTMFELLPEHGVKLSKIVTLQDNIALRLAASSVRIVAPIPGKAAVGIEVPNKKRSIVSFREIIEQDLPDFTNMTIPVVLGKDILGKPQLLDLVKTPHLLIAGATGSGKSVCVNTMILSILYKRSPEQVKLILIDPKIVELKLYNDIPHLLTPVITESKKAFQALQYCLCEMERRYSLLDGMGVRDIFSYNRRIKERNIAAEQLPCIVVIIDEFADLMATTGKELETTVARLAAMSRAVGIHLVLATQRPSIDVITGLIKANIPSRIAFMVASKMDSRIIIDQVGAEMLLGKGDMLYASAIDPFPSRIQGTFVSDNDVENVVSFVKNYGEPDYIDDEIFVEEDGTISENESFLGESDPLYDQALDIVIHAGKASASYIQRRLKIGYNRAARLVEEMEERGIVGPANGSKPREIIHIPD